MKLYGAGTEKHLVDWQFITTKNADVPILFWTGINKELLKSMTIKVLYWIYITYTSRFPNR